MLRIDGACEHPATLTFDDLAGIGPDGHVDDVSALDAHRRGAAVRLSALLERVGANGTTLAVHATDDGYRTEVPVDAVRDLAVVIYAIDGEPLAAEFGGPLRFLVPNADACGTSILDTCANVKFVDRIEVLDDATVLENRA